MTRTDLIRIGRGLRLLNDTNLLKASNVLAVNGVIADAWVQAAIDVRAIPTATDARGSLSRDGLLKVALDALAEGYNCHSHRQNQEAKTIAEECATLACDHAGYHHREDEFGDARPFCPACDEFIEL